MKSIPNFPDYCITKDGRVWSIPRNGTKGGWLKLRVRKHGYLEAFLRRNNERFYKTVHRLVLETYIGPCPVGMESRHLNGNRLDNRLENLVWGTPSENTFDAIRHRTHRSVHQNGEKNLMAKLTEEKVEVILYLYKIAKFSLADLAWQFDVTPSNIWSICTGKTWNHLYAQI